MERIFTNIDEDYKDMKELEYKKNLQRLKEYKYYKTKLKDPNTKKQMVTPKYPE